VEAVTRGRVKRMSSAPCQPVRSHRRALARSLSNLAHPSASICSAHSDPEPPLPDPVPVLAPVPGVSREVESECLGREEGIGMPERVVVDAVDALLGVTASPCSSESVSACRKYDTASSAPDCRSSGCRSWNPRSSISALPRLLAPWVVAEVSGRGVLQASALSDRRGGGGGRGGRYSSDGLVSQACQAWA